MGSSGLLDIFRRRGKVWLPLIFLAALIPSLAACGGGDETLVIYSGRISSLVGPLLEQFSQDTGTTIEVKYGSTSSLAATLLEEGSNSPADVFFAQDPGGLGAVEGLFDTLPADLLEQVPAWARSTEGLWVGISGRARVVAYNTTVLSEQDLPDDIWDFVDPKWKGRIGWAPPNASFQTMVTGMRVLWGEEKTRQWLQGILANEPRSYSANIPVVDAVGEGEVDVGFVNHYYLYQFLAEEGTGFPARNYHVRAGGPGAMVMVAGAGVLKTSGNKGKAQEFVEYLLSEHAQQYFSNETHEYPLVSGVETSHDLPPLSQINAPSLELSALDDLDGTLRLLRETGVLP
jgi:iron(III) transport system substrate-binding protein